MSPARIVARSSETARIDKFLDAIRGGSGFLLLEGEAGIGKTTLLRWARSTSAERGYLVLSASPVESEVPWEFAGLADLLAEVPEALLAESLAELPPLQRRALAVAVFREEPSAGAVDVQTLATAVRRILVRLSAEVPVVLAIDDLPWLDPPSARVLSYVLRRAGARPIGLVGAVRTEWVARPTPLVTDLLEPERIERIEVAPIGLGAMGELLAERIERPLGRATVARVHELSGGNPLFALELASGADPELVTESAVDLGVPRSLRQLVQRRIAPLSLGARDILLVAALSGEPTAGVIFGAAANKSGARNHLDEVVAAGFVHESGEFLSFVHPLVRSVIDGEAGAGQRRDAHRRLAGTVRHREARARHLALGAEGPDEQVAAEVEAAALTAAARGACETAAALAQLSVSLTPPGRLEEWQRRSVLEADNRFEASDPDRAAALLASVVDSMEPSSTRAELRRRLARCQAYRGDTFELWLGRLAETLDEAGDDVALRGRIAADLGTASANHGDLAEGWRYGNVAMEMAQMSGDAVHAVRISAALAFLALLRGKGVRQNLIDQSLLGPEQPLGLSMEERPRVIIGHLLHWSDDLDGARDLYEQEYERAEAEGVETSLPMLLCTLVENEAWAGKWERAEELCAVGSELADHVGGPAGIAVMAGQRALLHVYRGRIDEGVNDAEMAISSASAIGFTLPMFMAAQALGLAGLSVGDAAVTHERLAPIMETIRAVGISDPGFLPFVPDEIEALIRLNDLAAAEALLDGFEARAIAVGRVRALATSARCRGLLLAARGDFDGAEAALDSALERLITLPMPFERARTLLVAGEISRRARRKRRAQIHIAAALEVFSQLGAPHWEQRARDEAGRLGLSTGSGEASGRALTDAENRVAELVVAGRTNLEVATQLFMARRTVEAHLSRIYRKLGVHSRTQLCQVYPPDPTGIPAS